MTPSLRTRAHAKSHGVLTLQLIANALTGYLFVRLMAFLYGTSAEKDAFDIAYSVPFFLVTIGGLSFLHSLVTVRFSQLRDANPDEMSRVYSSLFSWTIALSVLLSAAVGLFAMPLVQVFAPGLEGEHLVVGTRCLRLLLPLTGTYAVSALTSAVLLALERPISMELSQVASRLVVILAGYVGGWNLSLELVCVMLLSGSLAAATLQIAHIQRTGSIRFVWSFSTSYLGTWDLHERAAWMLLAALASQIASAYLRRLATLDVVGTTASLGYAFALVTPIGVIIGKPLAQAFGPEIIRGLASDNPLAARARIGRTAAVTGALGLGCAICLSAFAEPITVAAFGTGQFDQRSVELTQHLLEILAWSLPQSILLWVLLMPMLASKSPRAAGIVYLSGYAIQLLLTPLLFGSIGRLGLAWAYVAGMTAQAVAGACVVGCASTSAA